MGPSESINRALNTFFNSFGTRAIWRITFLLPLHCPI
jgi:hypothetical protein